MTYFPLVFVYGLTTWALWVVISIGSFPAAEGEDKSWTGESQPLRLFFLFLFPLLLFPSHTLDSHDKCDYFFFSRIFISRDPE